MSCPLSELMELSSDALHQFTQGVNKKRASAEWKLAFCLLAIERNQTYVDYHCSSTVVYAERFLELAPYKSMELIRIARALEHLPLLSQAYQEGALGSGKLRELVRVVSAKNESTWLTFAVTHNSRELERAVAQTPKAYHQAQANASTANTAPDTVQMVKASERTVSCSRMSSTVSTVWQTSPTSQAEETSVSEPLLWTQDETPPPAIATPRTAESHEQPQESCLAHVAAPAPPTLIRLTFVVTTDEYANFESAKRMLETQKGQRMSRDRVLGAMAKHIVERMDTRTRLRKGLIVHTDMRKGDTPQQVSSAAYYETDRGCLAVNDPEVRAIIEEKVHRGSVASCANEAEVSDPRDGSRADIQQDTNTHALECAESFARRKPVPRGIERKVFECAQWRCELCDSRDFLQLDHKVPRCRGGNDEEGNLQVLCRDCHSLKHREDFLNDVKFQMGYEAARTRRAKRAPP